MARGLPASSVPGGTMPMLCPSSTGKGTVPKSRMMWRTSDSAPGPDDAEVAGDGGDGRRVAAEQVDARRRGRVRRARPSTAGMRLVDERRRLGVERIRRLAVLAFGFRGRQL